MVLDGVHLTAIWRAERLLMMRKFLTSRAAWLLVWCAGTVHAADLMQIWQAAQEQDPKVRAMLAMREAGETRRTQADALWRPTVGLSMAAGAGSGKSVMEGSEFAAPGLAASGASFSTQVGRGTMSQIQLAAKMPVYAPARQIQSQQLSLSADIAQLQWQASNQQWTMALVQRYFAAVLAQKRHAVLSNQLKAAENLAQEAMDRYRLGDKPVTDSHEAKARAYILRAQVLEAENAQVLLRAHLRDLTGLSDPDLQALASPARISPTFQLAPLAYWDEQAGRYNLELALQKLQVTMAGQDARKYMVGASTSVDLVAQSRSERLDGSGLSDASTHQRQAMLGVAVNLPLYTGGWRSAKLSEAMRLQESAQADLERVQQDVRRATRTFWLTLQSAQSHLEALEEALRASLSRLDATKLGHEVGDRTTLELLQAQNDSAGAELALLQAQIELALTRLQLAAQVGQLNEQSLREVNASLRASPL